jgi:hypothetical protein
VLVQGVLERLAATFELSIEEAPGATETVSFKLPRVLA